MTPLPGALGGTELVAWRLDAARHAAEWDSGEGAYLAGGRWNSPGVRAVYCAIDPATAILEVAAHKGLGALDAVPHILTALMVGDPSTIEIVRPEAIPRREWLRPGIASARQQAFGDGLLARHRFVLIPSVVSNHSWNLVFLSARAGGTYGIRSQEPFALDPRLHAPRR